jgi:isopenicillin-N epimerase
MLPREISFLNHGSYGARPRPVFEEYQRWQRELEAQPVEFLGRRHDALLTAAREPLAQYIGTQRDNLIWVPNTTQGINIIARSLDLKPGDEILGTNHEYGAVDRTWRYICGLRGATYRIQPIPTPMTTPEVMIEALWAGVTERTRVIVVSHITSPTALIFPVAAIARRAREAGILTVIDGAHAPGQLDLNVEEIGADFYTGNCHKWLCAPPGAGFLYARPEVQALLQPLIVSWGWESRNPSGNDFQDYFGWVGTHDPAAYLSVPAAIAFQREHDWTSVRAASSALAAEARQRIAALTNLEQIAPESPEWLGQMRAMPLPIDSPERMDEIKRRLWAEYQVEIPLSFWNGHYLTRISVTAYNSPRDVDRLLGGLERLL